MQYGGKGNEPWYKSRRVWAAALSIGALVGVLVAPDQYDNIVMLGNIVAGYLGITSWRKPQKQ